MAKERDNEYQLISIYCLECDNRMIHGDDGKVIYCSRCGRTHRYADFPTLTGQYWGAAEKARRLRDSYREKYPAIVRAWKEIEDEQVN